MKTGVSGSTRGCSNYAQKEIAAGYETHGLSRFVDASSRPRHADRSASLESALTIDAVSLADGAIIANGHADDLGQAIGEIVIIQQFADIAPSRQS
jgi:hypothetical protein